MGLKGTWDGAKCTHVSSGERKESAQPCTLLRLSWASAEGVSVKRPMWKRKSFLLLMASHFWWCLSFSLVTSIPPTKTDSTNSKTWSIFPITSENQSVDCTLPKCIDCYLQPLEWREHLMWEKNPGPAVKVLVQVMDPLYHSWWERGSWIFCASPGKKVVLGSHGSISLLYLCIR